MLTCAREAGQGSRIIGNAGVRTGSDSDRIMTSLKAPILHCLLAPPDPVAVAPGSDPMVIL